jgi:hypothetical protein
MLTWARAGCGLRRVEDGGPGLLPQQVVFLDAPFVHSGHEGQGDDGQRAVFLDWWVLGETLNAVLIPRRLGTVRRPRLRIGVMARMLKCFLMRRARGVLFRVRCWRLLRCGIQMCLRRVARGGCGPTVNAIATRRLSMLPRSGSKMKTADSLLHPPTHPCASE